MHITLRYRSLPTCRSSPRSPRAVWNARRLYLLINHSIRITLTSPQNVPSRFHFSMFHFQIARYNHPSGCPSSIHSYPQCRWLTHSRNFIPISITRTNPVRRGQTQKGSPCFTPGRYPPHWLFRRKASLGAPESERDVEADSRLSASTKDTTRHSFCNPWPWSCRTGESLALSLRSTEEPPSWGRPHAQAPLPRPEMNHELSNTLLLL